MRRSKPAHGIFFISDLLALRIILHTSFEEMFKGLEPLNRYEQEQKER